MKPRLILTLVLFLIAAQDSSPVAITFPASGDFVSGEVTITGSTDVLDFASSRLDFSYASDPTGTWFALEASTQPAIDSPLALWDTTLISDGNYVLRLRVFLTDGSVQEVTIPITVQNDSPILTPAPMVTSTPDKLDEQVPTPFRVVASPTPTSTPRPTPTTMPENPALLKQSAIYASLGRGALVIIGLFAFVGLMLRFRRY